MRRLPAIVLLGVLLTGTTAPAVASAPDDDPELVIEEVEASDHPEIAITVSVPQELVGVELDAGAFRVTEAGASRAATSERLKNHDLQVVLALDVSGSMAGEAIAAAEAAATGFLEAMPPGVDVALVTFDATATVVSPFPSDTLTAAARLEGIEPDGSTALYDGILLAAAEFPDSPGARRFVVLLSDGGDTASEANLADAATALADAAIGLHAIELESDDSNRRALQKLAAAAGGTVVSATDPEGLSEVFATVASQLVNRYRLTFRSGAHEETELAVRVRHGDVVAVGRRSVNFPAAPPPPPPLPVSTTAAPEVAPEPAPVRHALAGTVVAVPWQHGRTAMYVGAGALFLALLGLLFSMGMGSRGRIELTPGGQHAGASGTLNRIAGHATGLAERSLQAGRLNRVSRRLERAGLAVRPGEFVVLLVSVAVTGAALGGLLLGPLAAPVGAGLGLLLVSAWLRRRTARRQTAFADQLPDILQLMSGGLRAGYGLMQALDAVATAVPAPAGVEFQRVKTEVHLGKDTEVALRDMAQRMASDDFRWVVEAVDIHRQVGGDLGEILDAVGETIRDRRRIKRRITSLSAEGRISGFILCALPFVVAGAIALLNPGYFVDLTGTMVGRGLIGGSLLLMTLGIVWMNRITAIRY